MTSRVFLCVLCAAAAVAFGQRSTPVQLLHPSGAASDQFGNSVAIDGDTMVVGTPQDDIGANTDQGSAHVYRWTGSGWTFEATLTASDGLASDRFGFSVAISGDTVVVGAYQDDAPATDQGSAYVFVRSAGGTTWTQQARLTASDGATGDQFGVAVAVYADTVLVGSQSDDNGASLNQGSAYVFVRAAGGTTWTQQAKLTAADGLANDFLGYSVALSGDTALIGAFGDDNVAITDQGSAYVFVRAPATGAWTQQAKLTAADGAAQDAFGYSVAISGETALIGAYQDDTAGGGNAGSAYVFTRAPGGTVWAQQAQLTASDGAFNDQFGLAVALRGDTALVGAWQDDAGAVVNQGAAYVFSRAGSAWTQTRRLTAPDGAANDNLGNAVALGEDTAVLGANGDDVGANSNQGSAWVFSRVGTMWIGPDLQLLPSDGESDGWFGSSTAMSGDTAVIGAEQASGIAFGTGAAYVFVRGGSGWVQQAKLTANDGATTDYFGQAVAIQGDTIVVGAPGDNTSFQDDGSAYVFVRSGTTWTQQAKIVRLGADFDQFGYSVSVSNGRILVGAPGAGGGGRGRAYLYQSFGASWFFEDNLIAPDEEIGDWFGSSVCLNGNVAVIGAPGKATQDGAVYIYTRSPISQNWENSQKLMPQVADGQLGYAVAISGNTVLASARAEPGHGLQNRGAAYVYTSTGGVWSQQARLARPAGLTDWNFGVSLALSGDVAVVCGFDLNPYAATFVRSGTSWTPSVQLTAPTQNSYFGNSVGIANNTIVVGSKYETVGPISSQGAAYAYDIPLNDLPFAANDVTGATFSTLNAALLPAQSGEQISASASAFKAATNLDTLGRAISLQSRGDLRTVSSSVITLGNASSLVAPAGETVGLYGIVRTTAGGSGDITADSFALGSRGILTARTNSSLTINAATSELQGQTRLEQGASLTFGGSATAIGPTTCSLNSSLTAGGTFTNIDTFTITAGTLSMPLFYNRAAANIFGSSAVFGSYTNEAGSITTIRSGTLFVFGSLTNNGTIIGTICASCVGLPPNLDVGGSLTLGAEANLIMPFTGSAVRVGGNFDCAINSNTRYDMSLATLRMDGGGSRTIEVMSRDIGPDPLGLDRNIAGHYPIGVLEIGPTPGVVVTIDTRDNDGLGQTACEAVYVNNLIIHAGSTLDAPACKIYYQNLQNNGTILNPQNVIQLGGGCPADLNGDGVADFNDYLEFLNLYNTNDPRVDFNLDGIVDFNDYLEFLNLYNVGC